MKKDEIKYFDSLGNPITKEQAEAIAKSNKNKIINKKIAGKDKLLFDKTTINK